MSGFRGTAEVIGAFHDRPVRTLVRYQALQLGHDRKCNAALYGVPACKHFYLVTRRHSAQGGRTQA